MSDFVKRWIDDQVDNAEPGSVRQKVLEAIESATAGAALDESSLRDALLSGVVSSDADATDD